MIDIENGVHYLSGISPATFSTGWDEEIEGYVVQIDGQNYGIYSDPDDGYRSYGCWFPTDIQCTNTFPPQKVLVEQIDTDWEYEDEEDCYPTKRCGLYITNEEHELILHIGTVWYDSYYPMATFEYHPENLPINK